MAISSTYTNNKLIFTVLQILVLEKVRNKGLMKGRKTPPQILNPYFLS